MRRFATLVLFSSLVPFLAPRIAHADPTPPPVPDTAFVHIDSPRTVDLEMQVPGGFRYVCKSPCDVALPTNGVYRVSGMDVRPSATFGLAPEDGHVSLHVSPAGNDRKAAPIIAIAFGGIGVGGGLLSMAIGALMNAPASTWPWTSCGDSGSPQTVADCEAARSKPGSSGDAVIAGGAVVAVVGAVLTTIGIVTLVGGKTDVEQPAGADVPVRQAEWKGPGWSPPVARTESLVAIHF